MTCLDDHQFMAAMAGGFSAVRFDPDSDTPVPGSRGGNQGGLVPLLSTHYVHKLSERWRLGFSVLPISGAVLDPDNDWVGRNDLTNLSLLTLTFAPSIAVKLTDWLSLGAGPNITYAVLDWKLRADIPLPRLRGSGPARPARRHRRQ